MKTFIALFLVIVSLSSLSSAQAKQSYPLRVSVMTNRWEGSGPVKHGTGKANVQDGKNISAVDYTFDCAVPFLALGMNKPYPGVWKEKGSLLVLSVTKVTDPDNKSECELHVTPAQGLYVEKGGRLVLGTAKDFHEFEEANEKREKAEIKRTLETYPLRVLLLEAQWSSQGHMRLGIGRGNVRDGKIKRGFEFSAKCPAPALQNLASAEYMGKWAKQDELLLIAAPPAGDADVAYCEVNTKMQSSPYKLVKGKAVPDVKAPSKPATKSPSGEKK